MWNRPESSEPKTSTDSTTRTLDRGAPAPSSGGGLATIGPSITIRGALTGGEDLCLQGRLEGEISVAEHSITVGSAGRVKADVYGRSIYVEGEVEGNLFGKDEVVIRASGKVIGNVTAPRVTLENGSHFRGSIDMRPTAADEGPRASKKGSKRRKHSASDGAAGGDKSKKGSESEHLPANASAPAADRPLAAS